MKITKYIFMYLNIYIPELWNISFTVGKILEITLATMIVILSPVDCANLKLNQERKKKKKIFAGILSIFYTSISTILYFYTEIKVTSNIVVCYITILLLLLIGIEKNKINTKKNMDKLINSLGSLIASAGCRFILYQPEIPKKLVKNNKEKN